MKFFSGKNWLEKLEKLWEKKFDFWTRMPRRKMLKYFYSKAKNGVFVAWNFTQKFVLGFPQNINFLRGMPRHLRITLGVVVPIAVLVIFAPTNEASAQFGFITNFASKAVGQVFFYVAWIISFIGGIVISVLAWITEVVLGMSTQVVNSPPVKTGFPIALAVTNMGFVAAVIVIAIATILRYGDYVVKKTLPKLIAAALLVNFSLVFAGAILNFADQFTIYFLEQINPAASQSSGFVNFSSAIAGAFNPQRLFINNVDETSGGGKQIEGVASAVGQNVGSLILPLTSVTFTVFTLIAIILTLIAFVALLLIRYVYLVVLLIVMPFVWLLWIFPGTKSYFSQWWSKFLKQVFFAPIVVFFLYLAILTAGAMGGGGLGVQTDLSASQTGNVIADFFGGVLSGSVQNLLNSLVIVGLMLGGMFAASKIGAAGASAASKAVTAGTAAIGIGMHKKLGGSVARGLTQKTPELPPRPRAPERSFGGRMLHPIETLKHGVAVAGWGMKKAAKPITDPIREKMGGKFAEKTSLETFKKVRDFGNEQKGISMAGVGYKTAWGVLKKTFLSGIEVGGHKKPTLKQLEEMGIHVADAHSEEGHSGGHGGKEKERGGHSEEKSRDEKKKQFDSLFND